MDILYLLLIVFVAVVGHLAICTRTHSLLHSMAWKQETIDFIELFLYAYTLFTPLGLFCWIISYQISLNQLSFFEFFHFPLVYFLICWTATLIAIVAWGMHFFEFQKNKNHYDEQIIELIELKLNQNKNYLQGTKTKLLAKIPGNQILQLSVNRKKLYFEDLSDSLDQFTITHISDLHLTGKLTPDFYHEVVKQVQSLNSDMIVIAGDIYDYDHCLAWAEELFQPLQAKHGVYFVLGNHDNRLSDPQQARDSLTRISGIVDLARTTSKITIGQSNIFLAGSELPWFPSIFTNNDFSAATACDFRILLSHTPDQIVWASEKQFDLMLAGHNHGGQIRLPGIGPLVSPSRYGVRFASGVFKIKQTLMHVSRGIAGTHQLRINCAPEITQLVLCKRSKNQ